MATERAVICGERRPVKSVERSDGGGGDGSEGSDFSDGGVGRIRWE